MLTSGEEVVPSSTHNNGEHPKSGHEHDKHPKSTHSHAECPKSANNNNEHPTSDQKLDEHAKSGHGHDEHAKSGYSHDEHSKKDPPKSGHSHDEHSRSGHSHDEHPNRYLTPHEHSKSGHSHNEHQKSGHSHEEHPNRYLTPHEHPKSGHSHHEHQKSGHSHEEHPNRCLTPHEHPKSGHSHHEHPKSGHSHHEHPKSGHSHDEHPNRYLTSHEHPKSGSSHGEHPKSGHSHDEHPNRYLTPHEHPKNGSSHGEYPKSGYSHDKYPNRYLTPHEHPKSGSRHGEYPNTGYSYHTTDGDQENRNSTHGDEQPKGVRFPSSQNSGSHEKPADMPGYYAAPKTAPKTREEAGMGDLPESLFEPSVMPDDEDEATNQREVTPFKQPISPAVYKELAYKEEAPVIDLGPDSVADRDTCVEKRSTVKLRQSTAQPVSHAGDDGYVHDQDEDDLTIEVMMAEFLAKREADKQKENPKSTMQSEEINLVSAVSNAPKSGTGVSTDVSKDNGGKMESGYDDMLIVGRAGAPSSDRSTLIVSNHEALASGSNHEAIAPGSINEPAAPAPDGPDLKQQTSTSSGKSRAERLEKLGQLSPKDPERASRKAKDRDSQRDGVHLEYPGYDLPVFHDPTLGYDATEHGENKAEYIKQTLEEISHMHVPAPVLVDGVKVAPPKKKLYLFDPILREPRPATLSCQNERLVDRKLYDYLLAIFAEEDDAFSDDEYEFEYYHHDAQEKDKADKMAREKAEREAREAETERLAKERREAEEKAAAEEAEQLAKKEAERLAKEAEERLAREEEERLAREEAERLALEEAERKAKEEEDARNGNDEKVVVNVEATSEAVAKIEEKFEQFKGETYLAWLGEYAQHWMFRKPAARAGRAVKGAAQNEQAAFTSRAEALGKTEELLRLFVATRLRGKEINEFKVYPGLAGGFYDRDQRQLRKWRRTMMMSAIETGMVDLANDILERPSIGKETVVYGHYAGLWTALAVAVHQMSEFYPEVPANVDDKASTNVIASKRDKPDKLGKFIIGCMKKIGCENADVKYSDTGLPPIPADVEAEPHPDSLPYCYRFFIRGSMEIVDEFLSGKRKPEELLHYAGDFLHALDMNTTAECVAFLKSENVWWDVVNTQIATINPKASDRKIATNLASVLAKLNEQKDDLSPEIQKFIELATPKTSDLNLKTTRIDAKTAFKNKDDDGMAKFDKNGMRIR